jgi:hypothetical protein
MILAREPGYTIVKGCLALETMPSTHTIIAVRFGGSLACRACIHMVLNSKVLESDSF